MTDHHASDRLAISVAIEIAGRKHAIPHGDVKRLALDAWSYGHEGLVEFYLADDEGLGGGEKDELYESFLKPDLATVSIEIEAVLSDALKKSAFTKLTMKGLVIDKTLVELPADRQRDAKLMFRRYGVRFVDAARLVWAQHHPCALYTKKSLKDVIEANKGDHVTIDYDWDAELGKQWPQQFLPLVPDGGASFYDFVVWYTDAKHGVLAYDYATQGYKLAAEKSASGSAIALRADDVAAIEIVFPEVIRHAPAILNSYTESVANKDVAQAQSVAGVRHDVLLTTPIAADVDDRVTLEKARAVIRGLELDVAWTRFPAVAFAPNALVEFDRTAGFAAAGLPATNKTFRVKHLALRAVAEHPGPHDDHLAPDAPYQLSLRTRLETKDEKHVALPPFCAPRWPLHVEGRIVSEQGGDDEETWQSYTDDTSQDRYHVKIPLWDDQIISAPFNPNLLPGHFFFPAYKGERVLVSLEFRDARIKRYLDWRAGARLPVDTQGVHLLVGKKPTNGTSMRHYYEDQKPIYRLQRKNEKDTQKVEIKEGNLLILVKEE